MDFRFTNELGEISVNEEVVLKIAGYAALECYGIVGMTAKRSTDDIAQLLGFDNIGRGVIVHTNGDTVDVELYIIVQYGISITAVADTLIDTVKYQIEHMTGAKVNRINVTVEDIRI